jgi:endonuclease/exonuclease/phosphatase family metal-dependent hydrolase
MSAGTAILVDRQTAPSVVDSGILMEGRTQYIKLQSANSGTLTIVNVYTARTFKNRTLLWKAISSADIGFDSTIIGGDFNHQEVTSYRGIASERQMHKKEVASWHHMTLQYGLTDAWCLDSFRKMFEKTFTFDNERSGAGSTISRIDKFMISQDLDSRGGRIESAVTIRKFSDHAPLIISIWGQAAGTDKLASYFDASLLEDERSKAALLQAWAGDSPTPPNDQGWIPWIEATIKRVMSCSNRLTREKNALEAPRSKCTQEKSSWRRPNFKKTQPLKESGTSC